MTHSRLTTLFAALLATGAATPAADLASLPPAYGPVIAASNQRRDSAMQALAEWKAKRDDLLARQRAAEKEIRALADRLGAAADPKARALAERLAAAETRVRAVDAAIKAGKAAAHRSIPNLLEHDRLVDERVELKRTIATVEREHLARLATLVRTDEPRGRALAGDWESLEAQAIAAGNEAVLAQARRDAAVRAEANAMKLLTSGPALPPGPAPVVKEVAVAPPADAAERRAEFAARSTPAGLRALAERFFSQMTLTHPGLETVAAQVRAGRPADALEAYKHYFFARLRATGTRPDASATGDDEDRRDGDAHPASLIFAPPTPGEIRRAWDGIVTHSVTEKGKSTRFEAKIGQPGAMTWVFVDPATAERAPDGPAMLEFCQRLGYPGMTGVALLHSYVIGGPKDHLLRWSEILDDWALNWQRDVERSPLPLRNYHLLYVCRIQAVRDQLRQMLEMRPQLVADLPAATLARWLMALNEEYLSSAIRLGRSGLYNFRIMALMSMVPTSLQMLEFHAHQWAVREGWRQVDDNFIYKIRQDGANFEFANDGHENTDQSLLLPLRALQQWNPQPPWTEPFWAEEFMDNFLSNTRYWIHNLKPDGYSYRLNTRTQRLRYLGHNPEYKINLLAREDEVRRRVWQVFRVGRPEPEPRIHSEALPFQGYYYLRSGWKPEDYFVYFQAIGQPILSGREDHNGFSLYGDNAILLLCPPPAVDGRTQNAHHGLVLNPGGKTHFASYGRPNVVKDGRFLAGGHFDFVEGKFDGVYDYHRPSDFYDVFGSYGYDKLGAHARAQAEREQRPFVDEPIRDTVQRRQVLSIRGRDTYIVTDVFASAQQRRFTQNYTLYTPVRGEEIRQRLELLHREGIPSLVADAAAKTLATRNLGLPNLQIRHFSALPIRYEVDADRSAEKIRTGLEPKAALKGFNKRDRQHSEQYDEVQFGQKVAVHWESAGTHTMVSLVTPQRRHYAVAPPAPLRDVREIAAARDRVGFTAKFADGADLAYLAAAQPAALQLGALAGHAAVLLLADGRGLALDCSALAWRGRAVPVPAADFEFWIEDDRLVVGQPIHRPIQPVTIAPAVPVFTDTLEVSLSCPTPGVELRYTLDGSRPTPQSPRYTGPFAITATCRVKARAFRPGVTEDVWQQDGTHGTTVFSALYRQEPPAPAVSAAPGAPGLRFEYFEGPWTETMARSLTYPAKHSGVAPLLDVGMRRTDGSFGVRYEGRIEVPADGVYTFHAPPEFVLPDIESGYDLRVFVNGKEWYPNVRWHGHGTWSVALAKGKHAFKVVFVDLRPRPHKIELMWGFPHPEFTWKGAAPTLAVSGPELPKQPVPATWLSHTVP